MERDLELNNLRLVITELNQEIYERTDGVEYIFVTIESNGHSTNISFLGNVVWSDEMDEREYYEDVDCYEPIETYLRRALNEEIDKIKLIKF